MTVLGHPGSHYRARPKKKPTAIFQNSTFFCQYQKFFLIKRKGDDVRFLWQKLFFHRPLLREKIIFLCFEKCRNFDFFPTLQIKELFLLKISICGFLGVLWVLQALFLKIFEKFGNFRVRFIPLAFSYYECSSRYLELNFD